MDHKLFVSKPKGLLIAPAGHGKTHSIVDCLSHTTGKQLILTHTHAGVSSIKEKLKAASIPSKSYQVETITSFAQKYVLAFYTGEKMPEYEDADKYYPFLISEGNRIITLKIVSNIIASTYAGLFVDEYQDCTLAQHRFISRLTKILPTRILGDPLQGIFSFNDEPMVNLYDNEHMVGFLENQHKLNEPWRWKKKNEFLGQALIEIRTLLEGNNPIDLTQYPSIQCIIVNDENDIYNPTKEYYKKLSKILVGKNILLIHPDTTSIYPRRRIVSIYKTPITLVEAIDDKDFYKLAKLCDDIGDANIHKVISKIAEALFNKTEVRKWFTERGLVRKKKEQDQIISESISDNLKKAMQVKSFSKISQVLKDIHSLPGVKCYRKDLFRSLCNALVEAQLNGKTVYDSMTEKRNQIRRMGRKVYGRCIGTTLLTKGLEFDTVIILNAHKFSCPKNLYVALTRASQRLIVFTTNSVLTPNF